MKNLFNCFAIICLVFPLFGCAQFRSWSSVSRSESSADAEVPDEVQRLTSIARLTERRGDREEAKKLYREMIQRDVAAETAHHRLGVMSARAGDLPTAMRHFQKARAAGLDTIEFQIAVGYAQLLVGEIDQAESAFQAVLSEDPGNKRTLNNLAVLRGVKGDFAASLAYSEQAVGSAKAHANLGYLLSRFGDVSKALESYHYALGQDPQLRVAANALLQLESRVSRIESNQRQHETVLAASQEKRQQESPKAIAESTKSQPAVQRVSFKSPAKADASSEQHETSSTNKQSLIKIASKPALRTTEKSSRRRNSSRRVRR